MASQQGWSQQTPAVQSLLRGAMGVVRRATKRRSKRKSATASGAKRSRKRSASARSSTARKVAGRLKKGSAAAKAYMAKIRKLRK